MKDSARQVKFDNPIPVDVEIQDLEVDHIKLTNEIENKVRELLTIRVNVTLVEPGSLGRTVYKTPLTRVRNS